MAHTLKPDPAFQKFNTAKEQLGKNFRFTKKNSLFIAVFAGVVPVALTYFAYGNEGKMGFNRLLRESGGNERPYAPRDRDL